MTLAISVIVMAFNEEANLEISIQEIVHVLENLGQPYELVIINDGSTDQTGIISNDLSKKYIRVRVVHHLTNQGLGEVYRTGFNQARYDLVTFFPADGQFPASIIENFVPLMDNQDMVLGYLPYRKGSMLSRGLSIAEKILYRILFGELPKYQGVFMFRRTMLNEIHLQSYGRGWAVVFEFIIKAYRGKYRLISVPTEIRPRLSGQSKVNNLHTILVNLRQAVELRRYL